MTCAPWRHREYKAREMMVAVDFDGTIVGSAEWPEIGEDTGAGPWLRALDKRGVKLIIWTCREGKSLRIAHDYWRDVLGVEPWGINENPNCPESRKAHAHVFVDERALGCPTRLDMNGKPIVDWEIVGPMLLSIARE